MNESKPEGPKRSRTPLIIGCVIVAILVVGVVVWVMLQVGAALRTG